MADQQACIVCNSSFEGSKKHHKVKLLTVTTPTTAKAVFPDASTPTKDSVLCFKCLEVLKKHSIKRGVGRKYKVHIPYAKKRAPAMLTPGETPVRKKKRTTLSSSQSPEQATDQATESPKQWWSHSPEQMVTAPPDHSYAHARQSPEQMESSSSQHTSPCRARPAGDRGSGALAMAKGYLASRHYYKAFKCFLRSHVRNQMIRACSEAIKKERKNLSRDPDCPFRTTTDAKDMASFTWDGALSWAVREAPLLMACLKATFPPPVEKTGPSPHIAKDNKEIVDRRTGMVLSMALFTERSHTNNFIQTCMGIELWKQGCCLKVIRTMNHLGMTLGIRASRAAVDKLGLGHDESIKEWKAMAETRPIRRRLALLDGSSPKSSGTYSVTWDNVQVFVHDKHPTHANQPKRFALTFGHQNKVNFSHLEGPGCRAIDVPPCELLPTPEVYQRLRERMMILVMRILVDNIPAFSKIKSQVNRHIPHEHTEEMNSKSNIVNLGALSSNPSSTTGVMEIMDSLHKRVPVVHGSPLPILCCGDGLGVERMINCKRSRNGGETPSDRLDGLIPTPQEFHKDILLLQDTWDELFKRESETSRGTIAHLKHKFGHSSLTKNVSANVQHSWDLMEFATFAYVTLMATSKCGMSTVEEVPVDLPKKKDAQLAWLRNLASYIVQFVWMPPEQKQVDMVAALAGSATELKEKDLFLLCVCGEDKDEVMQQCSSSHCRKQWLHLSCAGLTEDPHEDWFCSKECQEDGTYIHCWCQANQGGEMVQCYLAEKCKKHEWYHIDCLLPPDRPGEEEIWYCSEDCAASPPGDGADEEDYLQNYTKALMWEGLNHLARKDAVQEGDGPAMVDSWKMDLIRFWQRKHPKYFINGHYMLTGIGGWCSEDLRNDLIWNRVANITGRPGGNVGLDLINKSLNDDFKEMIGSRGKYTEKEVQRCAEMSGTFGKDIDKILTSAEVFTEASSGRMAIRKRQQADIKLFVKEFNTDKLFSYIPHRAHTGLESYKYNKLIKHPMKMAKKMRILTEIIDD